MKIALNVSLLFCRSESFFRFEDLVRSAGDLGWFECDVLPGVFKKLISGKLLRFIIRESTLESSRWLMKNED